MLEDNLSQQQPNKKPAKCRNFLAQNGEIHQFLQDNKAPLPANLLCLEELLLLFEGYQRKLESG
jgi:hypothetical protein